MLMFRQSFSKTRYISSWASDRVILLFFMIVTIKMLNLYFNPAHQASSKKVHYNGPLDSWNWQELHGLVQLDQFKEAMDWGRCIWNLLDGNKALLILVVSRSKFGLSCYVNERQSVLLLTSKRTKTLTCFTLWWKDVF